MSRKIVLREVDIELDEDTIRFLIDYGRKNIDDSTLINWSANKIIREMNISHVKDQGLGGWSKSAKYALSKSIRRMK